MVPVEINGFINDNFLHHLFVSLYRNPSPWQYCRWANPISMKMKKTLRFCSSYNFHQCRRLLQKQDTVVANDTRQEISFNLSTGQAIADNATEDINGIFMEAAAVKNLLGGNTQSVITANNVNGAVVSVTPRCRFSQKPL